jgi:hypothetical protein
MQKIQLYLRKRCSNFQVSASQFGPFFIYTPFNMNRYLNRFMKKKR